jgi:gluconate 2-dehydrogenase gamma chain
VSPSTPTPAPNRRAVLGLAAGALAIPGWSLAQTGSNSGPSWAPIGLSSLQGRTLEAFVDTLLPATGSPGAKEAGVARFIDKAVANWCPSAQAAAIRRALDRADSDARAAHGTAFGDLDAGQRRDIVAAMERDPKAAGAFLSLKDLTVTGYFTSEAGATVALRYDPLPGAYRGCIPLSEIGRAWAT